MSDSVTSDPGAAERVSANIRIMAMACPLTCMADEMAGCWSAVTIEEKVCATKLMPKKVIIMAKTCDSSLPYDGSTLRIELQSRKWFTVSVMASMATARTKSVAYVVDTYSRASRNSPFALACANRLRNPSDRPMSKKLNQASSELRVSQMPYCVGLTKSIVSGTMKKDMRMLTPLSMKDASMLRFSRADCVEPRRFSMDGRRMEVCLYC